jgi:hypothetical protein
LPALRNPVLECSDKADTPPVGAGVHACDSNAKRQSIPGPEGNTRQRIRFLIFFLIFVIFCLTLFALAARSRQPEREAASAVMDRFNQLSPPAPKSGTNTPTLRCRTTTAPEKVSWCLRLTPFCDFAFLALPDRKDHS